MRLFETIRGDKLFCDEQYFYRFRDEDADSNTGSNTGNQDGSSKADSTSKKGMDSFDASDLAAKSEAFRKCVSVKNRTYHMRMYKSVFVGQGKLWCDLSVRSLSMKESSSNHCISISEAVDALVYAGVAGSRKEAVVLGRVLAKDCNLFHHVTGDHAFSDDFLFFRFSGDPEMGDGNSESISETNSHSVISSGSQRSRLAQKAEIFRECADVRDRKHRLLVYKKCFVGSEVVDAMVCSELVKTRAEAVKLG